MIKDFLHFSGLNKYEFIENFDELNAELICDKEHITDIWGKGG